MREYTRQCLYQADPDRITDINGYQVCITICIEVIAIDGQVFTSRNTDEPDINRFARITQINYMYSFL